MGKSLLTGRVRGAVWKEVLTPEGGITRARLGICVIMLVVLGTGYESQARPDSWVRLWPGIGGPVHSLAIDPKNLDTLYAGRDSGVSRSLDGGQNWIVITEGIPSSYGILELYSDSIVQDTLYAEAQSESGPILLLKTTNAGDSWQAIEPPEGFDGGVNLLAVESRPSAASHATIYLEGFAAPANGGNALFESLDGGSTWQRLNLPQGGGDEVIKALAAGPVPTSEIYAISQVGAGTPGLFKSTDGAETWRRTNFVPNGGGVLAADPIVPGTVYAVGQTGALYRSADGGDTWLVVSNDVFDFFQALFVDPAPPPGTLYALMGSGRGRGRLFKWTNGGEAWEQLFPVGVAGIESFVIDPADSQRIYAGGLDGSLSKSTDGGHSWTWLMGGLGPIVADPVRPRRLYAGTNGGGLWKSTDGGQSWHATGLRQGTVYAIAVDPREPSVFYAGTDNGLRKSTDAGATWSTTSAELPSSATTAVVIDPTAQATIYARITNAGPEFGSGLFRSVDGGESWHAVTFPSGVVYGFDAVAVTGTSPSTLLVGALRGPAQTPELLRSADGGRTWLASGDGLPPDAGVSALAVNRTTPTTIYAGTGGRGVFKSIDGGGSWQAVNDGLGLYYGTLLLIDPVDADRVYASDSGMYSRL